MKQINRKITVNKDADRYITVVLLFLITVTASIVPAGVRCCFCSLAVAWEIVSRLLSQTIIWGAEWLRRLYNSVLCVLLTPDDGRNASASTRSWTR